MDGEYAVGKEQGIRLGQYLKLVGLVATGGEAKWLIQSGQVQINGQVETRRKRQLKAGDKITVAGQEQASVVDLERFPPGPFQDADSA